MVFKLLSWLQFKHSSPNKANTQTNSNNDANTMTNTRVQTLVRDLTQHNNQPRTTLFGTYQINNTVIKHQLRSNSTTNTISNSSGSNLRLLICQPARNQTQRAGLDNYSKHNNQHNQTSLYLALEHSVVW